MNDRAFTLVQFPMHSAGALRPYPRLEVNGSPAVQQQGRNVDVPVMSCYMERGKATLERDRETNRAQGSKDHIQNYEHLDPSSADLTSSSM